ncbi:MAG: AAA family ATPase [Thiohalocapsa sp.]
MKLLDLHLLAYGPFTDRHLDLSAGSEGLHLVFGPNEAGKSSALRALRALLYGVPERTQDDFRHGKTELRVGGLLRGADGSELQCYRRKGRKNTLLDANDDPVAEQRLTRLLGSVAEPLFDRLFGIDHEALVSGGQALLIERGREAEALFGTGLGSTRVHALLESLDQEAQSLFAPRASKPFVNAGLSRLSDIERRQRDVSLSARHWDDARRAVDAATGRLNETDNKLAVEGKRRSTLERIRRSLPGLARRDQIREQLAGLGDVPILEADFGPRREEALSKRRLAADRRSKARVRLEGLCRDAAALGVSDALLDEADAIDELRDRLGGYRKAARDRPALVARRTLLAEQARQLFAELRPDLSSADVENLRSLLGRRRGVTELGGRREALRSAAEKARASREVVALKLATKRDDLGRLPPPVSYEGLQQAVGEVRKFGDVDNAIAEANADIVRHEETCKRDLGSLGLWTGTLTDLVPAPLPSKETLQRFAETFQAIEEEKRGLVNSISESHNEQRRTEESLRALHLAGDVPTEAELRDARARRDFGWRLLRRHWTNGEDVTAEAQPYAEGHALPDVFEEAIASADGVADRLRRESQRVHDQAAAQAKLEACRQGAADAEGALQGSEKRRLALEQSWKKAWREVGVSPLRPREMSVWLDTASRLRDKAAGGDELRAKADGLDRLRENQRRQLISSLIVCGESRPEPVEQTDLRPLLDHAESRLRAIEQTERHRVALGEDVAEMEDSQRQLDREVALAEQALASWESEWAALMAELRRRDKATPGEVSDYLEGISDGLKLVDDAKELQLRILGIDQEADDFERDVNSLVDRLAPDLAGRPAGEAILQLGSKLTAQREANSRLDELNNQARQAEAEARDADAVVRAADEVLGELCQQACCDCADELQAVEARFLERKRLAEQLREVERELVEGGDGRSVEALAMEAAEVDRDAVLAELMALNQRIDQELRPAREEQFEQKLSAEREFRSMAGTDEASALAEQAQQTLSGLRGHAEKFVRLRLAARVLRDEIEGFRRRHRDPILTRASAYFSSLTCGSLTTIETDFDESDQPVLVGVRLNNERLRVEAMSTGTRDQLFLALRLATLDHYVENSEPLPLIVDDILIQFDDERSRATLDTLADFSAKTQVILFTHHERVVEEARRLKGAAARVFIHELG